MIQGPEDSVAPCFNVLFVCVGNSCRSQMAEALANRLGQGRVRAWSAGSRPAGVISAVAQEVMREAGLSMDGQRSKGLDEVPVAEMDLVVTMGCEVECPAPSPTFALAAGFPARVNQKPFAYNAGLAEKP